MLNWVGSVKVGDGKLKFNFSAAIIAFCIGMFGFSAFLMLIWDDVLIKCVHGFSPISYWQSVGLYLLLLGLSRLLVK